MNERTFMNKFEIKFYKSFFFQAAIELQQLD